VYFLLFAYLHTKDRIRINIVSKSKK